VGADDAKADLLRKASLIIWDEAPTSNRLNFEAVDRMLRDIMRKEDPMRADLPFGGKVMLVGGDFRQCLPIIPSKSFLPTLLDTSAQKNFKLMVDVCRGIPDGHHQGLLAPVTPVEARHRPAPAQKHAGRAGKLRQ